MKKNWFTFVELLVVITIIGVVFAAGVVSYTTISKNSRNARRSSDLEAIRQALEMCRSIDGEYPHTNQVYDEATGGVALVCHGGVETMKITPVDPKPCTGHGNGHYSYTRAAYGYTLVADCYEGGTKTLYNP